METDDTEIYFLIYCYFEDFNEIRDYLQERWCDYRDGVITLSAVALVTNTAFDIFQREEKILMSQIPRRTGLTTYQAISNLLFLEQGLAHVDYDSLPDGWSEQDQAMYEEADWICLPTYWNLSGMINNMGPTAIPIVPPVAPLKGTGPHTDKEMMSWERQVFMELISEIGVLKGLKKNTGMRIPGEDELTRGLTEVLATRRLPIWIIFTCHVYKDIRYIMGTDISRGHQELAICGVRMKSILTSYLASSKDLPLETHRFLQRGLDEVECWIIDDCFGGGRQSVRRAVDVPVDDLEPSFYYRRNPLLCGLLVLRYDLVLNQYGLEMTSLWGAIVGAAHLYSAIRHETPSFPLWKDIEALIAMHGAKHMFVGEPPDNPIDYCNRLELAIGAKPTNLTSRTDHGRESWPELSDKGYRALVEVAKFSHIFYERFIFVHDQPVSTLDKVKVLVKETLKGDLGAEESASDSSLADIFTDSTAPRNRSREDAAYLHNIHKKEAKEQLQIFNALTPVQVLDTLALAIEEESHCLSLDYFSFHMRCTKLLQALHVEFEGEIMALAGPIDENKGGLALLVRWIFLFTARESQGRLEVGSKGKILDRVAMNMKVVVEGEGDEEIETVKALIDGRYKSQE